MPIEIPNFTLLQELYEGQQTFVYRCLRNSDHLPVIIKILKEDLTTTKYLGQLRHEYAVIQKFNTPLIIKAY